MNPYLPPASPLVQDDEIMDLARLGRRTGALAAAVYVFAASGWVMMELNVFGPFLWVHGSAAMAALVSAGAWGGGLVARRGGGGWLPWCGAVLRAAAVCLLAGDAGLLASSSALAQFRSHQSSMGLTLLANPKDHLSLLGYGYLMAVAITASAGLFLRHRAQRLGGVAMR